VLYCGLLIFCSSIKLFKSLGRLAFTFSAIGDDLYLESHFAAQKSHNLISKIPAE